MVHNQCAVVLSGTPLCGKTSLAVELRQHSDLKHLDVDEIRQELYPNPEKKLLPKAEESLIMVVSYTTLIARGYNEVKKGGSVLLTGTFSRAEFKAPLGALYNFLKEINIAFHPFLLMASDEEIERRIEKRKREGSPSNIDTIEKFRWAKGFFQPIDFAPVITLDTECPVEELAQEVFKHLSS